MHILLDSVDPEVIIISLLSQFKKFDILFLEYSIE